MKIHEILEIIRKAEHVTDRHGYYNLSEDLNQAARFAEDEIGKYWTLAEELATALQKLKPFAPSDYDDEEAAHDSAAIALANWQAAEKEGKP